MNRPTKGLGGNKLPIAEDGGGNQILLDFTRSPAAVTIVFDDAGGREVTVADSFEEFIDSLAELDQASKDLVERELAKHNVRQHRDNG
jgi:hypothetical protein